MTTLQRSSLHASHPDFVGVRFQTRYGWELPQCYTDPAAEFQAATLDTALHDRSYAGRLQTTGKDALDLLNRLSTNQVLNLAPGQGAPTVLTTDRGRILDVVAVVNTGDHLLLLTSPGTQQAVIQWLDKYTIMEDLTVADLTPATTMLSVLGPGSRARLEAACGLDLAALPPFHTVLGHIAGQAVRVVNHPLGELPRYDLVVAHSASHVMSGAEGSGQAPPAATQVWSRLRSGRDAGLTPMGLEAYEALRVVQGVPAHGQELGEDYNPLEAGLMGAISFTKGCYIGQEVIARLDTYRRVQKHLATLRFSPGAEVSQGASLKLGGQIVGTVTSLVQVPGTGELAGLGYVSRLVGAAAPGTRLELAPTGRDAPGWAEIGKLPLLFGPGAG